MKTTNAPDDVREMLSALADGEDCPQFSEAELIDRMCKDDDARFTWQSMHLTRDVLQADYFGGLSQGVEGSAISEDFASRMRMLIDEEESFNAGNNVVALNTAKNTGNTGRGRGQPARRAQRESVQNIPFSLWKPVAGFGLAASLAGASFLFSQLWQANQSPEQAPVNQSQIASVTPSIDERASQFAVFEPTQVDSAGTRWRMDSEPDRNEQIEQRLNTLLTNHLEDASMGAVHGMLLHSRVVSYDTVPGSEDQ